MCHTLKATGSFDLAQDSKCYQSWVDEAVTCYTCSLNDCMIDELLAFHYQIGINE